MGSLTKFGTYGFLSLAIASQLAMAGTNTADKADRAATDVKKNARSVKRDAKKAGRKVTGNESVVKDGKDKISDMGKDVKDEAKVQNRKAKRHN